MKKLLIAGAVVFPLVVVGVASASIINFSNVQPHSSAINVRLNAKGKTVVPADSNEHDYTLPGNWTQASDEVDTIVGKVTVNTPNCDSSNLVIQINGLDPSGGTQLSFNADGTTQSQTFELSPYFEPGNNTMRTLQYSATGNCQTNVNASYTIKAIAVDVLGTR